jgi:fructose-bisphosphate aldolase, class II
MTTLLEVLLEADARRVAVGHFNVSDLVTLYGVVEAARQQNLPVVVGVSEAERRFIGVQELVAVVKSLRDRGGPPIFLNADHTHSLSGAVEAAKAGFDWVVCDFSSLPFDENLRQTKEAVLTLKALRPDILVEGEIGDIGTGSQIHDSAPHRPLSTPEEAQRFMQETAIDTLAPAVGNMHGVLKSMLSGNDRKHLNIERIRAIKERTRIFMTLHGGSDTAAADLRGAIAAGMTVVHINTEVRLAWRRGIEESFASQKDDIAPYTLLAPAVDAVKRVVGARLALFSGAPH